MSIKTDPRQPVNEFLLDITRELAERDMNTVVFAVPFELEGELVYVKFSLSVLDVVGSPAEVRTGELH